MKKFSFIISTSFVLAVIFGLSGCKKELVIEENSMTFDSLILAETYYLNSDQKQPSCNLQVDFVYPKQYKDEKILAKMQVLFIDKVLGREYLDLDPEAALQAYKDNYIKEFKQFETQIEKENHSQFCELDHDHDHEHEAEEANDLSYYLKIKNSISFNKNNIVSLLVNVNLYTGGAHGSHTVNCSVFDLDKGAIITEQQIFMEDYENQLASIIVDKIVKANELKNPQQLEDNGYISPEDIVSNNNFVIDEKGITYYFNEYEIAAYVVGMTEVFIPYKELVSLLKKDSPIAKFAGL